MSEAKGRVIGLGGIFFKCRDMDGLLDWYRRNLGIDPEEWGGKAFYWRDDPHVKGFSVWGPFQEQTEYFRPSDKRFMINLRVDDLRALAARLREQGQDVTDVEEHAEGLFAWILDPEGIKIELWQQAEDY